MYIFFLPSILALIVIMYVTLTNDLNAFTMAQVRKSAIAVALFVAVFFATHYAMAFIGR